MRQLMMHSTVPTDMKTVMNAVGIEGHSAVQ